MRVVISLTRALIIAMPMMLSRTASWPRLALTSACSAAAATLAAASAIWTAVWFNCSTVTVTSVIAAACSLEPLACCAAAAEISAAELLM